MGAERPNKRKKGFAPADLSAAVARGFTSGNSSHALKRLEAVFLCSPWCDGREHNDYDPMDSQILVISHSRRLGDRGT
jgi:hypothetical protein